LVSLDGCTPLALWEELSFSRDNEEERRVEGTGERLESVGMSRSES
jgi:hypothetical protein